MVRVCFEMCLDMMQHHKAPLGGAHPKLLLLQVWLQGGPCLAQEQVAEDLGPDGAYQDGSGASAWFGEGHQTMHAQQF